MMRLKDGVYVLRLLPEAVRAAVHGPEVKYYFWENNIPSVGAASETGDAVHCPEGAEGFD